MKVFENFDFQKLYFLKMWPVFVGTLNNCGRSEDNIMFSNRCISGFMPNLIKKSWTVSSRDRTKTKCPKRGGVPLDFQTLQHPCSHKNFKIETCSSTWLTVCRYFLDNKLDVGYTYSVIANALTREVLP